jgi:hypothetical protein
MNVHASVTLRPISGQAAAAVLAGRHPPDVLVTGDYPTEFSTGIAQQVGGDSPLGPFFVHRCSDDIVVGEIGGGLTAPGVAEIGYAIVPSCWGRGHATEAVRHIADARTSLLDHGGFWNTGQQLLAPANNGWYVITWSHANRKSNANVSLRAVVGHNRELQPSTVAGRATHHISTYFGATDGRGDTMILFSGSTDMGNGAIWPYTSGLYTTVLRH